MDFISILSIFVLACFVGYYVVWSVTPALHTPLMSVTNAISSVIVVGALIAAASAASSAAKWLGLIAVALASVNIFGGSGTVVGAGLGALFLAFIQNALILLRLSQFWLQAIYGLVILLAVLLDAALLRRLQRSASRRRA